METTKTYEIGGKRFVQQELCWAQEKWLAEHVFMDLDVLALTETTVIDMIRRHGTLMLAILLIEDGQTVQQKVEAGFAGVQALEQWLSAALPPRLALEYCRDFFLVNPPENLWLLTRAAADSPSERG